MKHFYFLLAVYFFVLSIAPCHDLPRGGAFNTTEIAHQSTDNQHDDTDHCSPFCTCNCCASPVIQSSEVIDFTCFTYSDTYYNLGIPAFISSIYLSFWQPPKIG